MPVKWKQQFHKLYEVRIKQSSGARPLGNEAAEHFIHALVEQLIKEIPDEVSRWNDEIDDYEQDGNGKALRERLRSEWLS